MREGRRSDFLETVYRLAARVPLQLIARLVLRIGDRRQPLMPRVIELSSGFPFIDDSK